MTINPDLLTRIRSFGGQLKRFVLAGRVTSETNGSGIPGLSVQAVIQGLESPTSTLTNEDGGFNIIYDEGDVREGDEITVVAYSAYKKSATAPHTTRVRFGGQTNIQIAADDVLCREHLSTTISLKPAEGRLFPAERLRQIYAAIALYGNTKREYAIGGTDRPGLTCRFPELNDFDDILLNAWDAVQGDPSAARQLQNSLDNVVLSMAARRGLRTSVDFHGQRWERYIKRQNRHSVVPDHEPIVPLERGALLIMGAKCIAGKDEDLANRNMNVVLSQLFDFYDIAPIYRTCRDAVRGVASAQSNVRRMIDIWGEDCQERNPLPDLPGRDPWDGSDRPMEPDLEDLLACLTDLFTGSEVREYSIDSLTPNDGCSNDIAVITGSGFGKVAGQMRFTGETISSSVDVEPNSWTDTRIEVTIPYAATFGQIGLVFPFRSGSFVCGKATSVQHRNVSGQPTYFIGGRPRLDSISFTRTTRRLILPLTRCFRETPFHSSTKTHRMLPSTRLPFGNHRSALRMANSSRASQ